MSTSESPHTTLSAEQIVDRLSLRPLEVEGGQFRQSWRSAATAADGRPVGTAIYALFTDDADSFSALHRLDADEVWHFYLGDPLEVALLHDDGSHTTVLLGPDLLGGQHVQFVVTAGTWMGAHVADGGRFSLIGTPMAPGFVSNCYEGGTRADLAARYPAATAIIERLTRPGAELGNPPEA